MTYIQPNKNDSLNKALFLLIGGVIFASFGLVILYNYIVNLEYGITNMRQEIKKAQTENVELREKTLALFDPENFRKIIKTDLVQDKNPDYLAVSR